jgi:GntR family transcriptional regulator/MocR family aminotransferase
MEPLLPLALELPVLGSRSRTLSLYSQLRAAILDGRLKPGLRLPSSRALAAACSVSRNTVVAAYELLVSEGYLAARQGSGTLVAEPLPSAKRPKPTVRSGSERRINPRWRLGSQQIGRMSAAAREDEPRIAFHIGVPDLTSFPYATWHRLSGRVGRRLRSGYLLTTDPQGFAGLREAIAQHVSFARAVACGPEDIVVTAGAQQAFDLLARVLVTAGRSTVALEDPGYPRLRAAFAAHGARIAPIGVDAEGMLVEKIPLTARVICVTPSHQYPLGAVMTPSRRAALLALCQRGGAVVIEDDYDGEFRFANRPLDALQTLDRAQSVFYVGTFSKCLLPDLRLGYIVAPPWARAALVAAKRLSDGGCSAFTQMSLALLIKEGHLARHVRKMQHVYARRRALLLDHLNTTFHPWLAPLPSPAGLHVTAFLNEPYREAALVARVRDAGVAVQPLRPFYIGRPLRQGLVFGLGHIQEKAITQGLSALLESMPQQRL